jgi:hypothetical protein
MQVPYVTTSDPSYVVKIYGKPPSYADLTFVGKRFANSGELEDVVDSCKRKYPINHNIFVEKVYEQRPVDPPSVEDPIADEQPPVVEEQVQPSVAEEEPVVDEPCDAELVDDAKLFLRAFDEKNLPCTERLMKRVEEIYLRKRREDLSSDAERFTTAEKAFDLKKVMVDKIIKRAREIEDAERRGRQKYKTGEIIKTIAKIYERRRKSFFEEADSIAEATAKKVAQQPVAVDEEQPSDESLADEKGFDPEKVIADAKLFFSRVDEEVFVEQAPVVNEAPPNIHENEFVGATFDIFPKKKKSVEQPSAEEVDEPKKKYTPYIPGKGLIIVEKDVVEPVKKTIPHYSPYSEWFGEAHKKTKPGIEEVEVKKTEPVIEEVDVVEEDVQEKVDVKKAEPVAKDKPFYEWFKISTNPNQYSQWVKMKEAELGVEATAKKVAQYVETEYQQYYEWLKHHSKDAYPKWVKQKEAELVAEEVEVEKVEPVEVKKTEPPVAVEEKPAEKKVSEGETWNGFEPVVVEEDVQEEVDVKKTAVEEAAEHAENMQHKEWLVSYSTIPYEEWVKMKETPVVEEVDVKKAEPVVEEMTTEKKVSEKSCDEIIYVEETWNGSKWVQDEEDGSMVFMQKQESEEVDVKKAEPVVEEVEPVVESNMNVDEWSDAAIVSIRTELWGGRENIQRNNECTVRIELLFNKFIISIRCTRYLELLLKHVMLVNPNIVPMRKDLLATLLLTIVAMDWKENILDELVFKKCDLYIALTNSK